MPHPFRLSLLTLGVADLKRAVAFYQALGMKRSSIGGDEVAFFNAGGAVLSLFDRSRLAEEAWVEDTDSGFGGMTLAFNVPTEAAVEQSLSRAEAAGGTVLKASHRAFWGGTIGYFADPDGHVWEVAYNPDFPVEDGRITLPE